MAATRGGDPAEESPVLIAHFGADGPRCATDTERVREARCKVKSDCAGGRLGAAQASPPSTHPIKGSVQRGICGVKPQTKE